MTETTLTDRYIDAATRTVPERVRADLAAELRASIGDQVDARVEAGEDRGAAERVVLTELGDPDKLAADYADRPLRLIGPRYYLAWWRLLKLLLWIVLPCVVFGVSLGLTLSGETVGAVIGTTAVVLFHATVHLCFWTTLVFALVERASGRGSDDALLPWSLDDLPEPRESGTGRGDLIGGLVMLALGAGAVLWDQHVGFSPTHPGLSLLDPGLWPVWVGVLFAVMTLEAVLAVAIYATGRWTIGYATANAVLNVAVAGPATWLLAEGRLLNPAFWPTLVDADSAPTVDNVLAIVVGFTIVGVAIWSIIDGFLKAARERHGASL